MDFAADVASAIMNAADAMIYVVCFRGTTATGDVVKVEAADTFDTFDALSPWSH